jgi:hypothetical protein
VEAVAGYKDYVFEDLYTEQSDVDSLFEKNSMQLPVLKEENGKHGLNPRNQETNYSEKMTPDDVDDIEDVIYFHIFWCWTFYIVKFYQTRQKLTLHFAQLNF